MKAGWILRMAVCVLALSAASLRCTKAEPPRPRTLPVSAFIAPDGVRLHYLDWGGNGKAMLLLAGLGNDARVFDTFAPRFTDSFHVYALTRRGFGKSDKPAGGYDTATRVEDIRAFLDQMKIDRAHLVGHSLAGDEMTLFASKYPERVMKLVYLDAAYDRHRLRATLMTDPAMTPSQKRLYLESIGSPEAAAITVADPMPDDTRRVLVAYMKASDDFQPDYRAVKAPALAFYAVSSNHPASAPESSLDRRKEFNAWWVEIVIPLMRANRDQFQREMRGGEVVELPDADHHLFLGRTQDQVAEQTRAFLSR